MDRTVYERTCTIERAEDGAEAGLIAGILATDGEASDGHILNIAGAKLPGRAPLLFGHDANSGTGNLGSWTDFAKFGDGKKLGDHGVRGTAQIELDGEGAQADWRGDIAMMIDKGHIGAFSVRWEETEEPVYRVNLPSDHPAFVDAKKETGRKRWGMWFEKWRLLEGSVVTLGADPAALVGRLMETEGEVRSFWRDAINRAATEREEIAPGLVAIALADGEFSYVPREAYDVMLEEANARFALSLDALENALEAREEAQDHLTESQNLRSKVEPAIGDEPIEPKEPERKVEAARLPAEWSPKEIIALFRKEFRHTSQEFADETIGEIRKARGQI